MIAFNPYNLSTNLRQEFSVPLSREQYTPAYNPGTAYVPPPPTPVADEPAPEQKKWGIAKLAQADPGMYPAPTPQIPTTAMSAANAGQPPVPETIRIGAYNIPKKYVIYAAMGLIAYFVFIR